MREFPAVAIKIAFSPINGYKHLLLAPKMMFFTEIRNKSYFRDLGFIHFYKKNLSPKYCEVKNSRKLATKPNHLDLKKTRLSSHT